MYDKTDDTVRGEVQVYSLLVSNRFVHNFERLTRLKNVFFNPLRTF